VLLRRDFFDLRCIYDSPKARIRARPCVSARRSLAPATSKAVRCARFVAREGCAVISLAACLSCILLFQVIQMSTKPDGDTTVATSVEIEGPLAADKPERAVAKVMEFDNDAFHYDAGALFSTCSAGSG